MPYAWHWGRYITRHRIEDDIQKSLVRHEHKYFISWMEVECPRRVCDHISRGPRGRVGVEVQISVEADIEHPVISQGRYEEVLILAFSQLF